MSSNLESFNTQMQSLISNLVITPLVAWLQTEKKVSVSADELFEVLRIPRIQKPLTVVPPNPLQPPIPLSTLGSSSAPSSETKRVARPKSKTSQPTLDNYTGPTCKYVFKRGENKGQSCGKPVVSGGEFCEQCNNKKTTSSTSTKASTKSEAEPKPVGFTSTNVAKRAENLKSSTQKIKVELRETGQPNTYIDTHTNIVVKKVMDKDTVVYVAVGVQEESGFRTLTEDEKKEALQRSFSLQTGNLEASKPADKKIVPKQPVSSIPDIESDQD